MPFSWGRKKPESPGPSPPPPQPRDDPSSRPAQFGETLPPSVRFRVERAYNIWGTGCVLGGTVESGIIRPPCQLRIEPGPASPTQPLVVDVVQAVLHNKPQAEVGPGSRPGLSIRGLPGEKSKLPGDKHTKWAIEPGDFLIST
jgi:hypothetical protein